MEILMDIKMERIRKLLGNNQFIEYLRRLDVLEADRIYCRHNLEHFFAVARIATILNEDRNTAFDRELIYAAALTHDLGRIDEYEHNIPHDEASERIAESILKECDYTEEEIEAVTEAIRYHRHDTDAPEQSLAALLYSADKMSRCCMLCNVPDCKIPIDARNKTII